MCFIDTASGVEINKNSVGYITVLVVLTVSSDTQSLASHDIVSPSNKSIIKYK